ncbi:MAG: OmpA family protein [Roseinatronobacter sp.]
MLKALPPLLSNIADLFTRQVNVSRQMVLTVAGFILAAALALGSAVLSVHALERVVTRDIAAALLANGLSWPEVSADGLLVTLTGEAATEAERFRALGTASSIVAAERVIDAMSVRPSVAISAPRFSLEVLRNGDDVSIIGLVPASFDVSAITQRIEAIGNEVSVVNMLESADFAIPFGWDTAVDFGLTALGIVPVSKISVAADQVEIFGLATSDRESEDFRARLNRARPRGLITTIDIAAPRPAITPFTLRLVKDAEGTRFDACSADSVEARTAILQAARQAGAVGVLDCRIGLGSPSPRWQAASVLAIQTLAGLGEGTVTLSDTDVSLVVPATVAQAQFDDAVGLLGNRLPDIFSLQATRLLPDAETLAAQSDLEFVASRNPEGQVILRGRLTDDRLGQAVQAMARSAFGLPAVQMQVNIDPETPEGWSLRALLAIDVLSQMEHGSVRVRPSQIDVTGVTGNRAARDDLAKLMVEKLGRGAVFNLNLRYDERFDPVANQPTPAQCEAWIGEILARQKITFPAGATALAPGAGRVLDEIADVLRQCGRLDMEIAGHTDSQGSPQSNMRLSQARAETVIAALLSRGVPVSSFVAKGYGPERPIADNGTAAGREINRRIEFRLIGASAQVAQAEGSAAEPATAAEPRDESALVIIAQQPGADATRPKPRPQR